MLIVITIFLCLWLLGISSSILLFRLQQKLYKYIKTNYAYLRNNLNFKQISGQQNSNKIQPFGFFKVLINFGNNSSCYYFLDQFVSLDEIKKTQDIKANILVNNILKTLSIQVKSWFIIIVFSLVTPFLLVAFK